ncbi:MAG: patatin-like phospholipase family protein [Bacteroidales bacterium]|jgi:NTE family protein|nr:patatin-like phospholipase family protein [Bacteroidales bacterium]MCK9447699.1 patatin-like phospholipase family protein [Bacteroidales bacterium]MDD3700204.1 patatin-like phospholipase family protein [Bacteroidales bacterium]MDY0370078.1 patatin-like phospholipase family protein [Bacteroidales bacterium]
MGTNLFTGFALALSGGGARGIVHAGFLQALDEDNLKPELISGASMGAIVGALYCAGVKPHDMLGAIKFPGFFSLASWIGLHGGLGSLTVLRQQLEHYIPEDSFESLQIPLIVSVTNLNTARNELISSGPLYDVVVASSSIPVVFVPVKIGDQYYVDGGLTMNLPLSCLKKPGRMVVGSNSNHIQEMERAFDSMKQVGERSMFIAVQNTVQPQLKDCHLLFDPPQARSFGTFDFEHAADIFEIGYQEGKKLIPKIKRQIKPE